MPSLGSRTQMSSRLANMKFMQRGEALAGSRQGSTPSTPNGPPSKRIRLSTGASSAGAYSDVGSPGSVMSLEDSRHQEALERQAQEAGETQWVLKARTPSSALSKPPLHIVSMSLAELDAGADYDDDVDVDSSAETPTDVYRVPNVAGRMTFGKKPTPASKQGNDPTSNSHSDKEEDHEDGSIESHNPHLRGELQRSRDDARNRLSKKKFDKRAESNRLAEIRRKRPEVNLNGSALSAISGRTKQLTANRDQKQRDKVSRAFGGGCFRCGGDHFAKNCRQ